MVGTAEVVENNAFSMNVIMDMLSEQGLEITSLTIHASI